MAEKSPTEPLKDQHAYGWVHSTADGFVCDHCGTTNNLMDREMTRSEFRREVYDFLVRHKNCRPAPRPQ